MTIPGGCRSMAERPRAAAIGGHAAMGEPSVLLVEDDAPTRQRIAKAIQSDPTLRLAGQCGTLAEGLAALESLRPAVLLTDLDLPDGSGIDLIRAARAHEPAPLCMVITVFGDEKHVLAAIEAGALGYLLKDGTSEYVAASLHELFEGGSPISPPIARHLMLRMQTPARGGPEAGEGAPHLSEREREVLSAIVKGFSYAEIASLLGVSTHTVATHVRRLYHKLAVHSRSEAVYEALQLGIVKLDD